MRYLNKIFLIISLFVSFFLIPATAQEVHEEENVSTRNIDEFVEKTVKRISKVLPEKSGYIIHKKDNDIYIDLGQKQGVFLNMEFVIVREGKDIKHPVKDEFIGKIEEQIGELKIKVLRDTLSIAEVSSLVSGKQAEVGDRIYSKKRWNKIAILPIYNPKNEQAYFTKLLNDLIRDKILTTTSIELVSKEMITKILEKMNISNTNNFLPDKTLKTLAEKLKAEVIILGNIFDIGEEFFINLRFVNKDDGSVFFVINTELEKTRSLRAMVYSMVSAELPPQRELKIIHAPLCLSPQTLDPAFADTEEDKEIMLHIYDRLINFDSTNTPIPSLAESWNVSKDGKIWIFNLRKNVLFHNGEAFTAKDVLDSFQYEIKNSSNSNGAKHFLKAIAGAASYTGKGNLEGIEILDDYTIQITLSETDPNFLFDLAEINTSIFSNKSLNVTKESTVFKAPIGTGPYKFLSREDNKITLIANTDYTIDAPRIDQIQYVVIQDRTLEYQKFLAGEIDYYHIGTHKEKEIQKNNIIKSNFSNIYYIAINCQTAPFNNEKIRQALNYAIDKVNIIKTMNDTTAIIDTTSILKTILPTEFSSEITFPYTLNKEGARKILKENGFIANFTQEFDLVYPESSDKLKIIAEKIQENLMDIGVHVRLQNKSRQEIMNMIENSPPTFLLVSLDFAVTGIDSNFQTLNKLFLSQNKGILGNFGSYNNSVVDPLLTSGLQNTDQEKKKKAYVELENTILQDAPWIFLFKMNKEIAKQSNIMGITLGTNGVNLRRVFFNNTSQEPEKSEEKGSITQDESGNE
ncbi:ABC transporter substrate-binding protein [Candidatus Poribacteria bacterium]|nr:ABC transporter substrate-binding protein [Candidatus Poribacteria bacterium]